MTVSPCPNIVLNADCDPIARQLKNQWLRAAGFEVIEAETDREVLTLLAHYQPCVLLVHIRLPHCSVLCQHLKQSCLANSCVILLIGTDDASHGSTSYAADGYLQEPVTETELLTYVRLLQRLAQAECDNTQTTSGNLSECHVTLEVNASEALHRNDIFVRNVIDSLPALVVVLDNRGTVRMVNEPWERYARSNGGNIAAMSVGVNYLDVCRRSIAAGDLNAQIALRALEDVQSGRSLHRVIEYACDRPDDGTHWFLMDVRGLLDGSGMIVSHIDITARKQMEEALRESEQRFRALAELSPDAILVHVDSRYTYANPAAMRLLDAKSVSDIVGHSVFEVIPPEYHNLVSERIRQMVEENLTVPVVEYYWKRLDGTLVDVEVAAGPILWQGKQAIQVVAHDITARKIAEEALRDSLHRERLRSTELRTILDTAPIGLALALDAEGKHIQGNLANEQLFGLVHGSEFSKRGPHPARYRIFHDEHELAVDELPMQRAVRGELVNGQIMDVLSESGQTLTVFAKAKPLFDESGKPRGAVGAFLDITALKQAERELQRQTEALSRINEELKHSNAEHDAFTYSVSHDLKEPLRGIHNFSHFLLEDESPRLSEAGQQQLATILRLSQRMQELIDALSEYSRVGRLELDRQPVELCEILDQVKENLQLRLSERGVSLRLPTTWPKINADRVRIIQVFQNLISNAIKYNDASEPWVEVGCEQCEPPVFYVRDNGIGLKPQHKEQIFQIFRRLHGRDVYGGGTGAGLTITKKIIERHGGKIWVESTPGKGSTFYFTLGSPSSRQ